MNTNKMSKYIAQTKTKKTYFKVLDKKNGHRVFCF